MATGRTVLHAGASLLCLLFLACSRHGSSSDDLRIHTRDGVVTVRAEVADTDAEQTRGLSGRSSLGRDAGMAFVFDRPVRMAFWMKDTQIPLSIAFWDGNGRIEAILDMPPCPGDPCPTYRPDQPFIGALEVNAGFFARNGVREGDRIEFAG
jgi:uncharacterized membrane protein (UPF0127 family)